MAEPDGDARRAGAVAAFLLPMLDRTWRGRDAQASMPAAICVRLQDAAERAGLVWRGEPPCTEPARATAA
ncbi:MAG: hypothetical protein QOI35_3059 [Cryptosporangiaceae bacterium]|nr:hypothetical protein [Cryptosporangiaceae bacterium]